MYCEREEETENRNGDDIGNDLAGGTFTPITAAAVSINRESRTTDAAEPAGGDPR